MGNINEKMTFDHNAHNLPKGKDSVRGILYLYLFIVFFKDAQHKHLILVNIKCGMMFKCLIRKLQSLKELI